ncbi:MAG: PQQ-dependent sugar dehydrogenase, partial [Nitrososphaeraceae archaeon]
MFKIIVIFNIFLVFVAILLINDFYYVFANPELIDSSLRIEIVLMNLSKPTGMTFVDNDIIVTEKNGDVRLISPEDNEVRNIFHFDVEKKSGRGLLAVESYDQDVFFYFTDASIEPIKNRIFKYFWDGDELKNPKLILDLPALPGPNHDGSKLLIYKNKKDGSADLYTVIGDLNNADLNSTGLLLNNKSNDKHDDTGVIFRIKALDGKPVENNPFSSNINFSKYFAYGIRNSFGIAIDPDSGNLWQTENGPESYDEINIVKPGFNSGWNQVMGPMERTSKNEKDLVMIPGSHYRDPILSWRDSVALT